jgi:sugar diacid utilization regulator
MNWERMTKQLEAVWEEPVRVIRIPLHIWAQRARTGETGGLSNVMQAGKSYFFLQEKGSDAELLEIGRAEIAAAERRLLDLLIDSYRNSGRKEQVRGQSEEEKKAEMIGEWCNRQLENGHNEADMPEWLTSNMSLYSARIPLLLYGDYSNSRKTSYSDLKKLLESFFEAEVILIPLMEKEWLILGSEGLLAASREDRGGGDEESLEDALSSICSGLHEMLSNEWVGECHLAIHYPMVPAISILPTLIRLRETMQLGKAFHVGDNIHLPWELRLEKLLNAVPAAEKNDFLEQVLKTVERVMDDEMISTLEMFFALDCNVSETAKKLYIHRNTLLYRLDKFKQETRLDVRSFSDAVLVRIAFLLYKVTKRK